MILHTVVAGSGPPVGLLHGLFGSAHNLGSLQRHLAARHRAIAIDLRNHGASPHGWGMDYASLAADVVETLRRADALPCALIGHSMGGKVAMRVALDRPESVTRLLVSDIAPVRYRAGFRDFAAAMARLQLTPNLTRTAASAALAPDVPDPGVRGFLLQNLLVGAQPSWRIGLAEIAAGLPDIEDWPPVDTTYDGPTLFVAGALSDYIQPEHRVPIRALFPAARFVQVKNAGHWVHADNLAGFLAALDAFLTIR